MTGGSKNAEQQVCRSELDALIREHAKQPRDLIAALQAIQQQFHYLPKEALEWVAEVLDCDMATILGVATFYRQFRLKPAGKHTIRVCVGTACHVKGADRIYDEIRKDLKLSEGEDTDAKGQFTVEKVACIGCCMLAPAVQIDEVTYGPVKASKTNDVIRDFLKQESSEDGSEKTRKKSGPMPETMGEIRMCRCSSCSAAGANAVYQTLQHLIQFYDYPIHLKTVGCKGSSWEAPLLEVVTADDAIFRYGRVKPNDLNALLRRHFRPRNVLKQGRSWVHSLLETILLPEALSVPEAAENTEGEDVAIRFFGPQKAIVTEHQGEHDPLDFDEYEKHGGFAAYRQCLTMRDPAEIITVIRDSKLRGRGGGGFPTYRKWDLVSGSGKQVKYLICNGDEGDPGAFMDRMILESFPFRVIEGIAIAALAVGIREGFAYIRAEYGLAIRRFEKALEICRRRGLLSSENDPDPNGLLKLHLVKGAGAFVCGEETALIESVEGKRGMPRIRPPYPGEQGLWGQPTLINNVETFACVPWILRNGASAFTAFGTASSKGTKTFALAGDIVRSGLIEVPMGVTIRQIIEEIGGGVPGGKKLKAVQIGGPSGGCIPASRCDLPIDYEALQSSGAMMGSGGLVVLDEDTCMVDLARYFMEFIQDESCGKCTFCRIGTRRMLEILERLCSGNGEKGDLEKLEYLAKEVGQNSLCGLGKTAPNPVLSTLKYFRDEYEAHIEGRCPAGACRELIHYRITENCIGCTICAQQCPANAIPFTPYEVHSINNDLCTKCDVCRQVCPTEGAIFIE